MNEEQRPAGGIDEWRDRALEWCALLGGERPPDADTLGAALDMGTRSAGLLLDLLAEEGYIDDTVDPHVWTEFAILELQDRRGPSADPGPA